MLEFIEPGAYQTVKKGFPVLVDFALRFFSNDYNEEYDNISVKSEKAYFIATLIYNYEFDHFSFFNPHTLSTYLPAIQSEDTYYATDSFRLSVNGIAMPIVGLTAKTFILACYNESGRMVYLCSYDPSEYDAGEVVDLVAPTAQWKLMFIDSAFRPVCNLLSSKT